MINLNDPIDLTTLSAIQLQERLMHIRSSLADIQSQLAKWTINELPEYMLTTEWKSRALSAVAHHVRLRNDTALEITRRAQTPKKRLITHHHAFLYAAREMLPGQQFDDIMEYARDMYPEAFD